MYCDEIERNCSDLRYICHGADGVNTAETERKIHKHAAIPITDRPVCLGSTFSDIFVTKIVLAEFIRLYSVFLVLRNTFDSHNSCIL